MDNGSIKILLVDDEPDILEIVGYHLKKEGYQVFKASQGAEAVINAKVIQPHLILLDIMMPEMDGQAFYKEICKLGPYGNRFLFITGGAVTEASLEFEKKWLREADFCLNPSKQINCVPP